METTQPINEQSGEQTASQPQVQPTVEPIISVRNIRKTFDRLEVLKGIDLDIMPHEVVSIVGPSGAGKTTLLQIMGTLYKPDSGTLQIAGQQVQSLSGNKLADFRCHHLGFVFQFHQLLPEFTALENVMIPGMIAGNSQSENKKTRPRTARLPRTHPSLRPQALRTLRWRKAARSRSPCPDEQARRYFGRRTLRQSRHP